VGVRSASARCASVMPAYGSMLASIAACSSPPVSTPSRVHRICSPSTQSCTTGSHRSPSRAPPGTATVTSRVTAPLTPAGSVASKRSCRSALVTAQVADGAAVTSRSSGNETVTAAVADPLASPAGMVPPGPQPCARTIRAAPLVPGAWSPGIRPAWATAGTAVAIRRQPVAASVARGRRTRSPNVVDGDRAGSEAPSCPATVTEPRDLRPAGASRPGVASRPQASARGTCDDRSSYRAPAGLGQLAAGSDEEPRGSRSSIETDLRTGWTW
jgi:hypothetical protein